MPLTGLLPTPTPQRREISPPFFEGKSFPASRGERVSPPPMEVNRGTILNRGWGSGVSEAKPL